MGSTLVGPTIEDVDDVDPPSSHVIHIHEPDTASASTSATADAAPMSAELSQQLSLLDEKFSLLLAAHSREAAAVSARMDALESLKLGSLMAEAASSAASSAAASAASAAEAAQLVKSAGEAVECATTVMEAASEAVKQISADGAIPDLLADHCKTAALSARNAVMEALDEAREETLEFVEEQRTTVAAAGKRGGKKR